MYFVGDEEEVLDMIFVGKKKFKGKKGGKVIFDVLLDEDKDKEGDDQSEEDEMVVSFVGKKKLSKGFKKGGVKARFDLLEDEEDDGSNNG